MSSVSTLSPKINTHDIKVPNVFPLIRLGLCCINTTLRQSGIYCSRTCIRRTFTIERALELARLNISDIVKLIKWNFQNKIYCLRLSSDIFPHITDPETPQYTIDSLRTLLTEIGDLSKIYHQRLLFHPSQFNQVGTPNPKVYLSTCRDLSHQADLLDAMNVDHNGILIVHGGGVFGSKIDTIERWIKQFYQLPFHVQRRLAIENCERMNSIEDCLLIARACRIPVIFDFHHYQCWTSLYGQQPRTFKEVFTYILDTWTVHTAKFYGSYKTTGYVIRPIFHISEQAPDKSFGAHSDYIDVIPQELFDVVKQFNISVDLEVEAKAKELAIIRLKLRYPGL